MQIKSFFYILSIQISNVKIIGVTKNIKNKYIIILTIKWVVIQ